VIATGSHEDFRVMEALLNGREERSNLPLTVNAFTIKAKAEKISGSEYFLVGFQSS
jgi:hypothetical protein